MKLKTIVGLLIVLISYSCIQPNSKSKVQTQNKPNQLSYTNSFGIECGYAHKTITIYNDSTVSIHLQMDLSKEHNFPPPHNDQKFKIVIWPQELTAADEVKSPQSLSNELRNFLQNESNNTEIINILIAPNEKYVLTIGRLFEKPTNYYVSPNSLYVHSDGSIPRDCKNLISQDKSSNTSVDLGLRLDSPNVGVGCILIPCGQISYTEH